MSVEALPLAQAQARHDARRRWLLGVFAAALLASLLLDLASGPSGMGIVDVLGALWRPEQLDAASRVILLDVRLPYALMALAVGAALGLAGCQMQTALDNPLASPFTLGVATASSLGAALALVLLPGSALLGVWLTPLAAFACALASTALTLAVMRWRGGGSQTLVLFGIALMFALEALLALMQFLADSHALEAIVFWNLGSLSRAGWPQLALLAAVLAFCLVRAQRRAPELTLLRGGENLAASLGVDVARLRIVALVETSLLTAAALCFVGTIGFVGLVGPHIARLLVGEQHRYLLPLSALCGALMLSLASLASRTLIPGMIIPIGILTALVGVPLFMALILTQRREA